MTSRRLQITLQPSVLKWARDRAGISLGDLAHKMKVTTGRVLDWEESGRISVAQADRLAQRTHTPLGLLYLSEPPDESLPIPDFRTRHADMPPPRPSPDLLDTVYSMQRRQAWMRDDLIEIGAEPLGFVGSCGVDDSHLEVAAAMRDALRLADGWAEGASSWTDALRFLRNGLDDAGALVVFNGVVGNSASRKLDPDEFQGFALVDEYAPLIFVNNADFVAAKMFTLAHELAHICVGESGVSQFTSLIPSENATERFCDQAAAEFLVPESALRDSWRSMARARDPYQSIARQFKVSSIVAARRALDLELIDLDAFFTFYNDNKGREGIRQTTSDGGNFWNTQRWRISPRFAAAVVRAAKERRIAYREAYSLTGLRGDTFENLAVHMDIPL